MILDDYVLSIFDIIVQLEIFLSGSWYIMVTRKTFAQQSNDFVGVHDSIEFDINNMDFGNIMNGSIDDLGCISCDSLVGLVSLLT